MHYLVQHGLYWWVLAFAVILVAAVFYWRWEESARKTKIEELFGTRERLDDRAFYERYFQSQGIPEDVVCRVKRILERELDADLSRLRAEDDFSANMKFFWDYDSLASLNIVVSLEKEFKIKIADPEAEQTHTVADIVNLASKKVGQRRA